MPCNRLGESAPCHAPFWSFVGAVVAGNLAAIGTSWAAKKIAMDAPDKTRTTIAAFTGCAAFWLVGGLTWVALNRD